MSTFVFIAVIIVVIIVVAVFLGAKEGWEQGQNFSNDLKNLPDFTPEKTLIKINNGVLKGISIDSSRKKICFINNRDYLVKQFSDVIETQLNIDGSTVTKTSRGSQVLGLAVGGALGGVIGAAGTGALIGGLTGSTESIEKIKNVTLQVLINDLNHSLHEIRLSENTQIQQALNEANDWNSTLKVVIFQNT